MSVLEDGRPNLSVIDEAFGRDADLYNDVLQVQPNADSEQIQDAYFDKRNELFQILDSTKDDGTTEKKMDAVVAAVRILGDPDLRLQYDDLRTERLQRNKHNRSPNSTMIDTTLNTTITSFYSSLNGETNYSKSFEDHEYEEMPPPPKTHQKHKQKPNRRKLTPAVVSPENKHRPTKYHRQPLRSIDEESAFSNGSNTFMSEDDETLYTYDEDVSVSESILAKTSRKPKGILDQIRMEIIGACDDTSRSVNQVINVFTLTENDIRAVMGRIDKAKRQMFVQEEIPSSSRSRASSSRKSRSKKDNQSKLLL